MKKYLPLGFLFLFILCGFIYGIVIRSSIERFDIHNYIDNTPYLFQTYSYKIENPEDEYLVQKQNSDLIITGKVIDVEGYSSGLAYKIEYKENEDIKHLYILSRSQFSRFVNENVIWSPLKNQNKHLFIGNEYHFFLTKYKYTKGYKPKNELELNLYTYTSNPYTSMVSSKENADIVYAKEEDLAGQFSGYIYEYQFATRVDVFVSPGMDEKYISNYLSYRELVWGMK